MLNEPLLVIQSDVILNGECKSLDRGHGGMDSNLTLPDANKMKNKEMFQCLLAWLLSSQTFDTQQQVQNLQKVSAELILQGFPFGFPSDYSFIYCWDESTVVVYQYQMAVSLCATVQNFKVKHCSRI